MVQPWYTTVNSGIPWYHVTVPWYIIVLPWCKHGTKELVPWYITVYHGTLLYTMVHCIYTIVHPFATIWNNLLVWWYIMVYHRTSIPPWYKYLIPWYATVYHSIALCYYGTPMVQITYTMVCYPLWKYTIEPLSNAERPDCSILGGIVSVEGIAIVHQSWGYHGTIYHDIYHCSFSSIALWWIYIMLNLATFGTYLADPTSPIPSYYAYNYPVYKRSSVPINCLD